jgi:hypothetical protein
MREYDCKVAPFAFEINEPVAIVHTDETGIVRGVRRMEDETEDFFYVEYVDNAESFQKKWFRESLLTNAP